MKTHIEIRGRHLLNTILLIEDNFDCARMVQKLLTPLGYSIEHASSGSDGLKLARHLVHEPHLNLILVDIHLPDLSGNVVVLQIRHFMQCANIPIIAFTAEPEPKAKRIAMAFGCDGFLSKPIDSKAFPSQIASFIKIPQSHL